MYHDSREESSRLFARKTPRVLDASKIECTNISLHPIALCRSDDTRCLYRNNTRCEERRFEKETKEKKEEEGKPEAIAATRRREKKLARGQKMVHVWQPALNMDVLITNLLYLRSIREYIECMSSQLTYINLCIDSYEISWTLPA